jgi:uncharacterized repeat protein (TIGR01451 family)
MKRLTCHTTIALALGLGLTLTLLWLLAGAATPVTAAPQGAGDAYCVTPISQTYASCTSVFTNVQAAVDAASGGEIIKVAGGTYTDVHYRSGSTQTVYLNISVTIRGGYTTTSDFADPPDPVLYPTTLDAGGQGRVVYIIGNITPTLDGLRLTGGSVSGYNDGGAIRSLNAHPVISNCHIYGNWAGRDGGGIYVSQGNNTVLANNHVYSNTADGGEGGGVHLYLSPDSMLTGNEVYDNEASEGGGVYLASSDVVTLTGNTVYSNTAGGSGGGVHLLNSDDVALTQNTIYSNTAAAHGGGIYASYSISVTLTGNSVCSNTTSINHGGGIALSDSPTATLASNDVYNNEATAATGGYGGGIYIASGSDNVTLSGNRVFSNAASATGGGLFLNGVDDATVTDNDVYSNTVTLWDGGGITVENVEDAILSGNRIHGNRANGHGGGLYIFDSDAITLTGNTIAGNNTALYDGGGAKVLRGTNVHLVNNVIADNHIAAGRSGAGILVDESTIRLLHNTIARNSGGDGSGIHATGTFQDSTVALTNTILVSHTVGVTATGGSTITLVATLWGDGAWANGQNWGGDGTVNSTQEHTGDPAFVDPDAGDYHIGAGSAARDVGETTTVADDIDGDGRPFDGGPDLGADECTCYVRLDGTFYPTVQDAVDDADEDDLIQVAGTCRGVQTRANQQQVAYVDRSITIRGGYSLDFASWDPDTYPTTLDAQGEGRVVYVTGAITPTAEGLHLIHGMTSYSEDGSGVHVYLAAATISGCHIYSNTPGYFGAGLYLTHADDATLTNNRVHDNTSTGHGGGIHCMSSQDVTIAGNQIHNNESRFGNGGGLYINNSNSITASRNHIYGNTSWLFGSGIYIHNSDDVVVSSNEIYDNESGSGGGAFELRFSDNATLVNNVLVDNRFGGSGSGGGIDVSNATAHLLHNTIARNTGAQSYGVYVNSSSTLWLTNTILVSHTVGIEVASGGAATLAGTLWGDGAWANGTDVVGVAVTSGDVTGYPRFVDADGGDYHVGGDSAARDAGVPADVSDDIDGEARPFGAAPDLGADEVQCHVRIGSTYYATVQDGVDAAVTDDVIRVAGTCRGVGSHNVVAYITKTLTIRGGYSGDFSAWDPDTYPTTLDAQGAGGVIYIRRTAGEITATLEALRLTGGYAGTGGGVAVENARPIISGCHIYDNSAGGSGGGVYVSNGDGARFIGNRISGNASVSGLRLGGGLFLHGTDDALFVNNMVTDNSLVGSGYGAGIYMNASSAHLWHTTLARNSGGSGQGMTVVGTNASHGAWLTNTILVSHTVGIRTLGLSATVELDGTLWGSGEWANGQDTVQEAGTTILTGTLNWWGDPAFVDYADGNYHITAASDALDRGISTWVSTDIDGHPRSAGSAPDLGADEVAVVIEVVKGGPAWVNEGELITYTLSITNTGIAAAEDVLLTDTLPGGANFASASDGGSETGGVVSWPTFDVAPGVAVRTFAITATQTITNDDYAATPQEGPTVAGSVAVSTTVNHAPTADASAPQSLHTGLVTLDGSGSSDSDGDTLSFQWQQTGGPTSVTLSDAGTMTATFTAPSVAGTYIFALAVTDTYGLADSDTTTVTITDDAPVADAGAPQSLHSGLVTLDGSGSSDPEDDGLSFQWQQTGGPTWVTLDDADTMTATFTAPPTAGIYVFALAVTDTYGLADSDTTTVTITNAAPVADAGAPQSLHSGLVTLDGSGSGDPDDDGLSFQWQQTGGPTLVTLDDADTMTATFSAPPTAGIYIFALTITDTYGLADSDTTTVTISLPDLSIAKSGPGEVEPGELITYTLVVANNGSAAATTLVITDVLPSGATFVAASDGGSLVGGTVTWAVPNLEAGQVVTRTFTVTARATITNSEYGVTCAEGIGATGSTPVTTEVKYKVFLPLVVRTY